MKESDKKLIRLRRRQIRNRSRIRGTGTRPRLTVFRSAQHIYAQLIDDSSGRTLGAASSLMKSASAKKSSGKTNAAIEVGKQIAEVAKKLKIETVVFDRGGYRYHGRVKSLAEAAREHGLNF